MNRNMLLQSLRAGSGKLSGLQKIKWCYRPYVCPLVEIIKQIPNGASLFDVGCGNGTLLYLGKQFRNVKKAAGCDISPSAVAASKAFPDIDVSLLAIDDPLPIFSDCDIVSMVDVLHHIPVKEQGDFLKKVVKNMDPGSELLIADINAGKLTGAFLNQMHDLLLAREWVHPWTAERVRGALRALGCCEKHFSLHRSLWYPHFVIRVVKEREV